MIWIALIVYIIPALCWIDLLQTVCRIMREKEEDLLVGHMIIGIFLTLCPILNLVILVCATKDANDWEELAKYSIILKILFKKI